MSSNNSHRVTPQYSSTNASSSVSASGPASSRVQKWDSSNRGSTSMDVGLTGDETLRTWELFKAACLSRQHDSDNGYAADFGCTAVRSAYSVVVPSLLSMSLTTAVRAGMVNGWMWQHIAGVLPKQDHASDGVATLAWNGFVNAGSIMVGVVVLCYLFALLLATRLNKLLWISVVATIGCCIVVMLCGLLLELNLALGGPLDSLTLAAAIWSVTGLLLVGVFFEPALKAGIPAALRVHQISLIVMSAAIATPFMVLSEWTLWLLLVLLIVWDLVAVLLPCGPFAIIMRTVRERKLMAEAALPPGLVYPARQFQLGVGDLVFYSVLAARASVGGVQVWASVVVSILAGVGAIVLLLLMASDNGALPALPISVAAGIVAYFISLYCFPAWVACASSGVVWL